VKNKYTTGTYILLIPIFLISALMFAAPAYPENPLKLKKGAKGRICLKCHDAFKETLKSLFVHTPAKNGECSGCHNPHTSSHGELLDVEPGRICFSCHRDLISDKAGKAHMTVLKNRCLICHDPHASDYRFILVKKGNELCAECHRDIDEMSRLTKFTHTPAGENCMQCHNPHGSTEFAYLLKNDIPALCMECHDPEEPAFMTQHMDYPVVESRCSSCHDSHGSDNPSIILDNVHEPVAQKKCGSCHSGPDAKNPGALKNRGLKLCWKCHKSMIRKTLSKGRVHWTLLDKTGCLHCHNAHASREKNLLAGPVVSVCGKCHEDTVKLQEASINNPENKNLCRPVQEGKCTACHSPHSADNILLLPELPVGVNICGKCHDLKTHSTHPMGAQAVDKRNKNLSVGCLSCHRACGTGNHPSMLHFETTTGTCAQCHREMRE
jgi:predicted CXXCH cytochrome family protein